MKQSLEEHMMDLHSDHKVPVHLLLFFVLFCRYKCQSRYFYAHPSNAVCTTNKWESSGGKSCPVVSASVFWQIQWMKDWAWTCYGVVSSKSRLNCMWFFVLGHCEREHFPNSHQNWILKTRCFSDFQMPTWKMSRITLGKINFFLRRKDERIQMTSN